MGSSRQLSGIISYKRRAIKGKKHYLVTFFHIHITIGIIIHQLMDVADSLKAELLIFTVTQRLVNPAKLCMEKARDNIAQSCHSASTIVLCLSLQPLIPCTCILTNYIHNGGSVSSTLYPSLGKCVELPHTETMFCHSHSSPADKSA